MESCVYTIGFPDIWSGIKIFESNYSESGSVVVYDTSALPVCHSYACLADSMATAYDSIFPDNWTESGSSVAGRTGEHILNISIVDIEGNISVIAAEESNCSSVNTEYVPQTSDFMTFEDLTDIASVEVMISFFVLAFAFFYWLTKK